MESFWRMLIYNNREVAEHLAHIFVMKKKNNTMVQQITILSLNYISYHHNEYLFGSQTNHAVDSFQILHNWICKEL
jgi:hypothetical protein